jgi:hypothetical protein
MHRPAEHAVVDRVFVEAGAESGRAHLQCHLILLSLPVLRQFLLNDSYRPPVRLGPTPRTA